MSSPKSVQRRIRSVKNTGQITKAMEVVSATKMRRSQEWALRARPYAVASLEMLKNLLRRTHQNLLPPLLYIRPVRHSLLLVVTSDKGLAGAYNANVLKRAERWVGEKVDRIDWTSHRSGKEEMPFSVVTIGKKARDYFLRLQARTSADRHADLRIQFSIEKSFWGYGDFSTFTDTMPLADLIIEGFLENRWDEVVAVYMNFRTTLRQEVALKKILPATKEGIEEAVQSILPERGRYASTVGHSERREESSRDPSASAQDDKKLRYHYEYKFEPSSAEILGALVSQLIRMQIHHIILESNASEHSARMVAMKNASDNAKDLVRDLTLTYNKIRQAGITRELTEITAGSETLER